MTGLERMQFQQRRLYLQQCQRLVFYSNLHLRQCCQWWGDMLHVAFAQASAAAASIQSCFVPPPLDEQLTQASEPMFYD